MAFTLLFTEAGRAALINAAQTGTEKRTVVSAGVTDISFTPSADMTELPGEIKRIEAVSGAAIAPDQISLAILDTGTDTYSVTGIGLYLDEGTLLAVFSQEEPFMVKTEYSFAHFQYDVLIKDASIKPEDIQFGSLEFLVPPATETIEGVARLATQEEADTGTDDETIITPKKLSKVIEKKVVIATPQNIKDGTAGKLVDAKGLKNQLETGNIISSDSLVKYMSDRFAYIYPNGGSEANPATITLRSRYVMDNPFPGHQVACEVEIFYAGVWGTCGQSYMIQSASGTHYGVFCNTHDGDIVLQTALNGVLGPSYSQLNTFGITAFVASAQCRVKVWRID